MPHCGENLTRENEIIDWPIFSWAAGATTKRDEVEVAKADRPQPRRGAPSSRKTAAVTNRAFALLKRFRPLEA